MSEPDVKPDPNALDEPLRRLTRDALASRLTTEPADACLDAETLAAFADDQLSKAERLAVIAHASTCARCQALLAAMAQTAPEPEVRSRARFSLRWLVPLTAAAAVLALWVAVPNRPAPTPVATDLPRPYGGASARLEPAAPLRDQPASPSSTQPSPQAAAPKRRESENAAPSPPAFTRSAPVPPPTVSSAQARQESRQDLKAEAKKDATSKEAQVPESLDAFSAPRQRAPAAPAQTQVFGAAAARAADPFLAIASADAASRWRIARATTNGIVERSTDGGVTWQSQATGADAPIAAGAAPSAVVCWLVGARGTIRVTTDGVTWRRVPFPETVDLVDVAAGDARMATVRTSDNRVFTTSDGGATWTPKSPAPLQENPAAPF